MISETKIPPPQKKCIVAPKNNKNTAQLVIEQYFFVS